MKISYFMILTVAVAGATAWPRLAGAADTNTPASFKSEKEKISYSIGVNIGTAMKNQGFDVDVDTVSTAIKDVLAGHDAKLNPQQAMENIRAYQRELANKRMEEIKKQAEKNKKEGEAFLTANKSKPGVKTHSVTLPDGTTAEMQYKVLKEGTGEIPKSNDLVEVNFRGTMPNGKEFASSSKTPGLAPRPASAGIKNIQGTAEALQMMKVGSKWEVYIPSSLAYKDNPGPDGVEPGSPVIFELELLGVKAPPPPPPPPQPLTSDIIKVPSAEEMKKGAKIEVLKPEDVERAKKEQEEKERKEKEEKEKAEKKP